ncbi:DUF6465 family protein [Lachnospira multipara]|uniref:DUF6465 family protein n=1 Tax=Lachnospira multipara TaxID=28051 RepID=UPI00068E1D18|nr:DUF6465 family protein [Lachnospira multipara]
MATTATSSVFGTKTADVKVEAKEIKATTAKKATTKETAAKKATKKATTKTTTTKSVAAKPSTTTAKKTVKKELFVQYLNQQVELESLEGKVLEDLQNQGITANDLKLYLKPEDNACYYVANGNIAGKVDLF